MKLWDCANMQEGRKIEVSLGHGYLRGIIIAKDDEAITVRTDYGTTVMVMRNAIKTIYFL